jgi:hypothetical protein
MVNRFNGIEDVKVSLISGFRYNFAIIKKCEGTCQRC